MKLAKIYGMLDKVDDTRTKASKLYNKADFLEINACNVFNKQVKLKYLEQLCAEIDDNGEESEKQEIHDLIEKKQRKDFVVEDMKKYRVLDEKYGESLEYNKTFVDRLIENMEE